MRLNAAMKSQVVQKAMDHKFKKRIADNRAECLALGHAMWDHLYGDAKRAFAKIPKNFLFGAETLEPYYFNVKFTVGGQVVPLNVKPGTPLPYARHSTAGTINDRALVDRCRAWQGECQDLAAEQNTVKGTLTAMLQNMQTLARLETDWPEGKKFYQSLPVDFPFNHQVPAVQVAELNSLLGLVAA